MSLVAESLQDLDNEVDCDVILRGFTCKSVMDLVMRFRALGQSMVADWKLSHGRTVDRSDRHQYPLQSEAFRHTIPAVDPRQ